MNFYRFPTRSYCGTLITAFLFSLSGSCAQFNPPESAWWLFLANNPSNPSTPTVQSGSTVMSSTVMPVTLPYSVDPSASFLLCSFQTNDSDPRYVPTCELSDARTVLIQTSELNAAAMNVSWDLIGSSTVNLVQRGTASFATGDTIKNITIGAVDTTRSFVTVYSRTAVGATNTNLRTIDDQRTVRARLSGATTLELERNTSGFTLEVVWQVVELGPLGNVQSGITSIGSGSASTTALLSPAVDTAKTFLLFNTRAVAGSGGVEAEFYVRGAITDPTTVSFARSTAPATNAVDISWFAVELNDGTTVQKGSVSTIPSPTSETILTSTLTTAVDLTRAVPIGSGSVGPDGSSANQDSGSFRTNFSDSSTLCAERGSNQDVQATVDWFAVQFQP